MLTAEENDLLTLTGPSTPMGQLLRRYWIPALFSHQLPEADCPPLRVRLLSEDLVAFRDTNGAVALLDAHCPHRGASLFFGRNEECGLRCVYHGWKFDVHGNCVDMPNEPAESNFKHKIKQTAYPCEERGGIIWTYLGPAELKPSVPVFQWSDLPEDHKFATRRIQECNWFQGVEGGYDNTHVQFLHAWDHPRRHRMPRGFMANPIRKSEKVVTDYGLMFGGGFEVEPGQMNWTVSQLFMPFYKTVPRVTPGQPIGWHAWVPIDDQHCMCWSLEYMPEHPFGEEIEPSRTWHYIHAENIPGTDYPILNKDNDYGIDRERQRNKESYTGIKGVGMQDTAIQESEGFIFDRTQEHLGTADKAIINIRQHFFDMLELMKAGSAPTPPPGRSYGARVESVTAGVDMPFAEAARHLLVPETAGVAVAVA